MNANAVTFDSSCIVDGGYDLYDSLAMKVLEKHGMQDDIPADVALLLSKEGFSVRQIPLSRDIKGVILVDKDEGNVLNTGSDKLIIVSDALEYEDARFVSAHEYGHYVRYKAAEEVLGRDPVNIIEHSLVTTRRLSGVEKFANTFAICMLMPKDKVHALRRGLGMRFSDFNDRIRWLADTFHLKEDVVRTRLEMLGLMW